ncbi:MAG TPA: 30S ribosomal protein S8 [Chloroflexota bacterium]|nr:30S ribosomal protein S8 [Chloroflexota bacterium]
MKITDPIADMLTRIRNATTARRAETEMPYSKMKLAIAKILKEEGFIDDFSVTSDTHPQIRIRLKYADNRLSVIQGLRRVSRPGLRQYARHNQIPRVRSGLGTVIVSTPRGVMSGYEAYRRHLGGELLAEVW